MVLDMDLTEPPPQISEMFSKFALALKTKTVEFFAEDEEDDYDEESSSTLLLDSPEEVITGQRVVVIKPDTIPIPKHIQHNLITSLFATISLFEASYLQLQTAHSPFDSVRLSERILDLLNQRWGKRRRCYLVGVGSRVGLFNCSDSDVVGLLHEGFEAYVVLSLLKTAMVGVVSEWQVIVCGILLVLMAVGSFANTVKTLMAKSRFKAKMKKSKSKQELEGSPKDSRS